jgi:hypothetical protein
MVIGGMIIEGTDYFRRETTNAYETTETTL